MTDQLPPPEPPPTASRNDVRTVGAFFLLGGFALIFLFPRDSAIDGIIPVWWFGILVLAFGAALLLFPNTRLFRQRVDRLTHLGNHFSKKGGK